ncbi:hypothetical protein M9Y10_036997 [Tritrichomonas musculus]|uniref:Uncharacterized protein n=1 Tax=Tritrichomonas musculus TaxID=1915356 RepID=A0ABR2GTG9_9EUKA
MEEFAVRVRYEDITKEVCDSLCSRLACEVIGQTKEGGSEECPVRYKKLVQEERKATKTILYENQEFDGIINYLNNKNNIKDEIDISYSSIRGGDGWRLFDYEDGNFVCTHMMKKKHGFVLNSKIMK